MEIEIKEFMPISNNDFIDEQILTDVTLCGDLIFKEVPINNIEKNSIILTHLENIINNNKINQDDFNIYFKRNKEWYNKFIFYKKNQSLSND
tara:strand:+ start:6233 stop:6508 length:276 start_codon:yes stop_codon:yes gene_type:complete